MSYTDNYAIKVLPEGVCPHCGRCPHCGQPNPLPFSPYIPYPYPTYPTYPLIGPVWTITSTAGASNVVV